EGVVQQCMSLIDESQQPPRLVHRAAVGEPFDQVGVEEGDRHGEQRPARLVKLAGGVDDHRDPDRVDEGEMEQPVVERAYLGARERVLVPAQAVYCPPPGGSPLGPAMIRWSSNGMGAHPVRRLALRHALLEALERDQLARTLPRGWTPRAIATRKVDATRLA